MHRFVIVAVVAAVSSACVPWKLTHKEGDPTKLVGTSRVAVTFDYSEFEVEKQPEAAWVEKKSKEDPAYAQTWTDMKQRFEAALLRGVQSKFKDARVTNDVGADEVQLLVRPTSLRMGHYTYVSSPPTVLVAEVRYVKAGATVDNISVERKYKPHWSKPSVWNHLHESATDIGTAAARYVTEAQ